MAHPVFEDLGAGTVAAEAIMLRGASPKAVLIVEGASDEKFWARFTDEEACEIVIARGKQNALDAMHLIRGQSVAGVICIVDADFDSFLGKDESAADVVITDDHDLETIMIKSNSFDSVVRELGSRPKIAKIGGAARLREIILDPCIMIGKIRLFSLNRAENLRFEGLKYRFADIGDWNPAIESVCREIYNNSGRPGADLTEVTEFLSEFSESSYDPWLIVCGHDLTELLGRALRSIAGNLAARDATTCEMEKHLRLACDSELVKGLRMTEAIREWQRNNAEFRCLPLGF